VPFVGSNYGGRPASWYDPNIRSPYVASWSGGFEWQFSQTWLMAALYQGSSGVKLLNSWDVNVQPIDWFPKDPAQIEVIRQQFQNYKPYPQFGSITHATTVTIATTAPRCDSRNGFQRAYAQFVLHVVEITEQQR
jgi:hypothetical protein